ncbi:hypothetical protein CDAR_274141 [Caerostris darwini]|uniref:Uncharacterized protein n=1 Tax=Caerostris darwini TaxID=1538125 RepID=A0AAV4RGN7_9ARAC|nr:hypothetical protein CDAR_274141 [Caerostris darwini]
MRLVIGEKCSSIIARLIRRKNIRRWQKEVRLIQRKEPPCSGASSIAQHLYLLHARLRRSAPTRGKRKVIKACKYPDNVFGVVHFWKSDELPMSRGTWNDLLTFVFATGFITYVYFQNSIYFCGSKSFANRIICHSTTEYFKSLDMFTLLETRYLAAHRNGQSLEK